MTESGAGAASTGSRLLPWLLALPLGLLPLLLPASPWSALPLLLALPLQLAAAAWALGHRAEPGIGRLLRRRGGPLLLLVAAQCCLLFGLLAWPVSQLLAAPSLTAVLLASAAVAIGALLLGSHWPLLALVLIDSAGNRRQPRLSAIIQTARELAQADPSIGRGVLATALLVALLGGVGIGLADPWLPAATRLVVFPLWTLLLAPFLAFALLALVEPARLASRRSPLSGIAAFTAAPPEPELLLPADLDPGARLYAAARSGRIDSALAELEAGADPHALPDPGQRDQRSLAMLAAVLGDLRLLRALIARGVDLNRRHAGLTPLLAATRDSLHGRPEAVMTLLANGADPRLVDAEGRAPLHFAALLADPEVAALLLDAQAPVDACNRDGYSALGVACAAGNWRMARFLLERKARPEPIGGQPALLAAAAGDDDPAGVMLLLKYRANVNVRGRLGRTALLNASLAGNSQIVDALLDAGAQVDAADDHQVTALLEAARAGSTAVLQRLQAAQASPHSRDHSGRNALVLACQSAQSDAGTIASLLEIGVDPQQPADDGRKALDIAIASGRWPLVAVLDPSYALPSTLDHGAVEPAAECAPEDDPRSWREQLHAALLDGDLAQVDRLLTGSTEPLVCSELFTALRARLPRPLRARLLAGIDASMPEVDSVLLDCVDAVDGEGLDLLEQRGIGCAGGGLLSRHLQACLRSGERDRQHQQRARRMLAQGADAFGSHQGEAPLTLAVRLGWIDLLRDLLQRGADPAGSDARGETALMIAAQRRCVDALPLLLRHGAQPDAMTADGRTPRGVALAHGTAEVIDWLDWSGWRHPGRALREADLVAVAAAGDRDTLRRLLALGLPVDGVDAQGATALLRACGSGHPELVADLLAAGADPTRAASGGATCLSAAVSRRQLTVIAVLLRHGVSADQPLPGEVTPLMVAAALGFPDVCRVLLDAGANARARDQRGAGVLHAVAQFGFSARDRSRALTTWELLLEAGADADARNADGVSPLLLLLGARMEPGSNPDEDCVHAQLERLLARSPALDVKDGRGFGPLHLAALHGQLRAVRSLLAAGADREARDALNRRPQDIAVMRGFVDIARELQPVGAATMPSIARLLRDPSP